MTGPLNPEYPTRVDFPEPVIPFPLECMANGSRPDYIVVKSPTHIRWDDKLDGWIMLVPSTDDGTTVPITLPRTMVIDAFVARAKMPDNPRQGDAWLIEDREGRYRGSDEFEPGKVLVCYVMGNWLTRNGNYWRPDPEAFVRVVPQEEVDAWLEAQANRDRLDLTKSTIKAGQGLPIGGSITVNIDNAQHKTLEEIARQVADIRKAVKE